MNRRDALSRVALIFGGTIIGSQAFLTGCKTDGKKEGVFETSDVALMDEIGETILPTTPDSPGAKEAKIGEFMKVYVSDCYTAEDQKIFTEGFNKINDASDKKYNKDFMKLTPDEKHELFVALDKEANDYVKNKKTEDANHYFTMMKQLTILGYFTSETGATKALRYLPVPGKFDGCYPYKTGDKAGLYNKIYHSFKINCMTYSRRKFLTQSGLVTAGALMGVQKLLAADNKRLNNFGLQLYSLRDEMPKDPKGVLKQVASFGYTQVESYEGKDGMFWGMSAQEFKNYMDELGMKIISSHTDINKDFEKKAADAASIDMKYLICPFKGPQKSIDDFKRFAEEFNAKGEICKKHGIRFAYHNHAYSFKELDGQIPQQVMMDNTDPETVFYEMDIYWVVAGGADPVYYFKKYEDRFPLVHVKDMAKNPDPKEDNNSVTVGTGSINFPQILHSARKCGTKYFIVEQERYTGTSPLQSAKDNAAYMQHIKI